MDLAAQPVGRGRDEEDQRDHHEDGQRSPEGDRQRPDGRPHLPAAPTAKAAHSDRGLNPSERLCSDTVTLRDIVIATSLTRASASNE